VTFETVPVVHVVDGRFPEYPGVDPERALTTLARRFGRVGLVDAAGIQVNEPQVGFIQASSRRRSLWVDAGPRYATDAMDVLVAGAEAATLRWNTLHDAKELEEAAELAQPGSLFVGLEYPKGRFLPNARDARSDAQVAALAERLDVGIVFILDAPDEGTLRSLPPVQAPRWVQGAPRRLVPDMQAMGFQGALLAPADLPPEETA
jgi:hypothetical protein